MRRAVLRLVTVVCLVLFGLAAATTAGGPNAPQAAPGRSGRPSYVLVPIRGTIGGGFTAGHMKHYLKQAAKLKPSAVVLEVDSPGGSTPHAEKIVNLMVARKDLRFVSLVRKALSAGAAVTLACREIYVTDTATIGAAAAPPPARRASRRCPPTSPAGFSPPGKPPVAGPPSTAGIPPSSPTP